MIRPIYLYGSEVLRKKAVEADLNDREGLTSLIKDLWDTLEVADGCGLAAPQIGVSQRVLIVDGTAMVDEMPYLKDFKRVMINPVLLEESEKKCEYAEGCLSVPNIYYDVCRPESIKVEYYNEKFEKVTEELDKFACRMVQHEMSHLDGCVFTDLVPPSRRKMLQGKLSNKAKGKVRTQYKTVIK